MDTMRKVLGAAVAAVLATGTAASADMHKTLQLDINTISVQAQNAGGLNSPFGGLNHTGSLNFSFASGITHLLGVFVQEGSGPWVNQGFNGQLSDVDGVIHLNNGQVSGGQIMVTVNNADTFSTQISSGAGGVTTLAGGGFRIEGLTFDGLFSGSMFGNVDVSTWFNAQPLVGGHPGSFLSFNFEPNASGAAFADMDMFIEVIPLPPAAWMGMAMMSGLMAAGYVRRRRVSG